MDAYLDIETTGFIGNSYPTVVGIAVDFPGDWFVVQLVGEDITADSIRHVLEGVSTVYTFKMGPASIYRTCHGALVST